VKQAGMLVLAIAAAVAAWWWFSKEMPRRQHQREVAAEMAAVQAERANALYRWRDDSGNLHITQTPPNGRKFERISRTPKAGMEVHGSAE
jgi:hypothetical protein